MRNGKRKRRRKEKEEGRVKEELEEKEEEGRKEKEEGRVKEELEGGGGKRRKKLSVRQWCLQSQPQHVQELHFPREYLRAAL
ncbi:hypothetical protein Pcinc_043766 [Petrolisthes cinctipes]|uniref:Uncharacterized protein n=1 Tax=Petrolisthes cinctipes TaxID=88211 RepID=A0AAE1BFD9_PETCI|nr:hypothetical protein Pcinc_043766 [Petrolisthes cinctipes]